MKSIEKFYQDIRNAKRRAQVRYALRRAVVGFPYLRDGFYYENHPYEFGCPTGNPLPRS